MPHPQTLFPPSADFASTAQIAAKQAHITSHHPDIVGHLITSGLALAMGRHDIQTAPGATAEAHHGLAAHSGMEIMAPKGKHVNLCGHEDYRNHGCSKACLSWARSWAVYSSRRPSAVTLALASSVDMQDRISVTSSTAFFRSCRGPIIFHQVCSWQAMATRQC